MERDVALKIHFLLDKCLPPVLRDSAWFTYLLSRLAYKKNWRLFHEFKNRAIDMTPAEFSETYRNLAPSFFARQTDINRACLNRIVSDIVGSSVLDVGCGNGFLSRLLAQSKTVVGCDINPPSDSTENLIFKRARVEQLPFEERSFDTVVCAHTLEHVQNFSGAVAELRRVAKRRLIVIVPMQRPHQFTFDLHLHFFPYKHSLLLAMGTQVANRSCEEIGGDLYYIENL